MDKKKRFLWIQAVLCTAVAVLLSAAAIGIFREGMSFRLEGDPAAWIFTREKAAEAVRPYIPRILASAVMSAAGGILRIRDEKQDMPAVIQGPIRHAPENRSVRAVRWGLLAAAVILIIAGILNGSMQDVLIKAVNVCSECIGLG